MRILLVDTPLRLTVARSSLESPNEMPTVFEMKETSAVCFRKLLGVVFGSFNERNAVIAFRKISSK